MALTVEDGTGLADANAYVDVAFVDAYAQDYGKTAWSNTLSAPQKEVHIRKATQFVDNVYLNDFKPSRKEQRLAFPAVEASIRGYKVEGIPVQLKEAVAELAIISVNTDLIEAQEERLVLQRTVKAGDVSKSETFASPVYKKIFHPVEMILRPLLAGVQILGQGVTVVKLIRT